MPLDRSRPGWRGRDAPARRRLKGGREGLTFAVYGFVMEEGDVRGPLVLGGRLFFFFVPLLGIRFFFPAS